MRNVEFKSEHLKLELARAHPEVFRLVVDLADFCDKAGIKKPVVITCIERDEKTNAKVGGVPNSRHLKRPCTAVDFRNEHYTDGEKFQIEAFLTPRCPYRTWERILRTHGTGPHYHLAWKGK